MQTLIQDIANLSESTITIIHEPSNQQGLGRPDFLVKSQNSQSILWYIENKKIAENLLETSQTDQIKKYRKLSENILLSNYTDWVWINGESIQTTNLCNVMELGNPKNKLNPDNVQAVYNLVAGFLSQTPKGINSIKLLAEVLAVRADLLEDFLRDSFVDQGDLQDPKLVEIYKLLKGSIDHSLSEQKFIDIFVQTLTYGLFLAKHNAQADLVDLTNAKKYISYSFPVIKYLVGFLDVLEHPKYVDIKWIFEEMLAILNSADREGISNSLKFAYGVKKESNLFEDGYLIKDPYVHFYEDFLTKYNNQLKFETGSFYTPLPVVDFIVRATDWALREKLKIKKWLLDREQVTVLDFATGTGTFLYEAINFVLKATKQKNPAFVRETIKEHILPNFHGLELMMAPYTIAHLKISALLWEYAYHLAPEERLKIYLSNTLDTQTEDTLIQASEMAQENIEANQVKSQPILAIIGNPPYSWKTNNPWLFEDNISGTGIYKQINWTLINEKNSKWLNDDYVKFIRFAEKKIEHLDQGIVAIITNHGFLDNPTFRGMRHHLMQTFDEMYFIDLHGNSTKKETSPDGSRDENVFDIKTGVAISILIKNPKLKKAIYHTDLRGLRKEKYQWLDQHQMKDISFQKLEKFDDFFLFIPQSKDQFGYKEWQKLDEMFISNSIWVWTYDDANLVWFDNKTLLKNVLEKYKQNDINLIHDYFYRAFDIRKTYYDRFLQKRPRYTFMKNMLKENIWINLSKNISYKDSFNSILVSSWLTDLNLFWGWSYLFPLFLYSEDGTERKLNIKAETLQLYRDRYQLSGDDEAVGYQILQYIYAILYHPSYREEFAEFLRMDFPRIPLVADKTTFEQLSHYGAELIDLHLLENIPELEHLGSYPIPWDNIIWPKITYQDQKIYINSEQYFDQVPLSVREFTIWGYQVIDKRLKYRKGLELTLADVEYLQQVMTALYLTDQLMHKLANIDLF